MCWKTRVTKQGAMADSLGVRKDISSSGRKVHTTEHREFGRILWVLFKLFHIQKAIFVQSKQCLN